MIFHIMIGQRKGNYDGEYAPEALEVMDDNAMGDNAQHMIDKFKEYTDSKEFTNIVTIQVQIPDEQIDDVLAPPSKMFKCIAR